MPRATTRDPDWQPIPVNGYARPKSANWINASLVPAFDAVHRTEPHARTSARLRLVFAAAADVERS